MKKMKAKKKQRMEKKNSQIANTSYMATQVRINTFVWVHTCISYMRTCIINQLENQHSLIAAFIFIHNKASTEYEKRRLFGARGTKGGLEKIKLKIERKKWKKINSLKNKRKVKGKK